MACASNESAMVWSSLGEKRVGLVTGVNVARSKPTGPPWRETVGLSAPVN